jgi:pyruvate/2-oxoacid:ferredoxin oxidoreductase beta subunit
MSKDLQKLKKYKEHVKSNIKDKAQLDEKGAEILDSTPLAIPVGFRKPPTLQDQMKKYVQIEMSRLAESQEFETWEEANDFEIGDDYEAKSKYQEDFDGQFEVEVGDILNAAQEQQKAATELSSETEIVTEKDVENSVSNDQNSVQTAPQE